MADDTTAHLGLPLPHPDHLLSEDVLRLRAALTSLDAHAAAQVASLQQSEAQLSAQLRRQRLRVLHHFDF